MGIKFNWVLGLTDSWDDPAGTVSDKSSWAASTKLKLRTRPSKALNLPKTDRVWEAHLIITS